MAAVRCKSDLRHHTVIEFESDETGVCIDGITGVTTGAGGYLGCRSFRFGLRCFDIPQRADDLQNFAAGREHPAVAALVLVQRAHELHLFGGIITLARGRIDLAAAIHLCTTLDQLFLHRGRHAGGSSLGSTAAIAVFTPAINCDELAGMGMRGSMRRSVRFGRSLLLADAMLGLLPERTRLFCAGNHGETSISTIWYN